MKRNATQDNPIQLIKGVVFHSSHNLPSIYQPIWNNLRDFSNPKIIVSVFRLFDVNPSAAAKDFIDLGELWLTYAIIRFVSIAIWSCTCQI